LSKLLTETTAARANIGLAATSLQIGTFAKFEVRQDSKLWTSLAAGNRRAVATTFIRNGHQKSNT
jgi:hypothetical protein